MNQRRRASSLILVVVIISAIIVVVFGANRLALVQYNQASRDEDNIAALYAAKAGIEDGLLRFRHHHEAETGDGLVDRVNLATGATFNNVDVNDAISEVGDYNPGQQYYDVGVSFKTRSIGDFDFNPDPRTLTPQPIIGRDSFLEISGFESASNPYFLRVAFKFLEPGTSNVCTDSNGLVQIQQIVDGSSVGYQQYTVKPVAGIYDSIGSNFAVNLINPNPELATSFRFRPYYCDVAYALATTSSVDGRGVDNSGAVVSGDNAPEFGGLITKVTATGYFGSTKRTLIADIDRISGQLISIYDFNVYSGEGDIKP